MSGQWGQGALIKAVYLFDNEADRLGHCDKLPKNGDYCLCYKHSGDFFYEYIVIRKGKDGLWGKRFSFGAYFFGDRKVVLSERKFHLLMAGCKVKLNLK